MRNSMESFAFITKPFIIEPLGIMYLSSSLKAAGHHTSWTTTEGDLVKKIQNLDPTFVGYSIMTGDHKFFDEINKKLKSERDFFAIAGGPHPTFFPDYINNSSFDAICRGEGEFALADLVSKYTKGKSDFPNFWLKTENGISKNPQRSLIDDMDNIPFPDRELIYRADKKQRINPIRHFIASRGCPYACTYCFNQGYSNIYKGMGDRVRFRSVDNLLEEMDEVITNYPTSFVYLQDDTFILKKEWVEEFSRKYAEKIKLPFHCHVRANLIDEDMARLLKNANCYNVQLAIESGNERLRNTVLNRHMSEKQIYNACELLHKHDIKFMTQNILGLPTSTLENDFETLEMNIKCKPDYGWASIFQPYPGTELGKLCLEENLVSEKDLNNIQSSFFDTSILNLDKKKEIEYLQKLFAISVKYPAIYHTGLLKLLLKMPEAPLIRKVLGNLYRFFRHTSDEKLYNMKL